MSFKSEIEKARKRLRPKSTDEKVKNLVDIMNYKYSTGNTLKEIHDEVVEANGHNGKALFMEFVQQNKDNEDFMKEFNKTSFIDVNQAQKKLDEVSEKDMKSLYERTSRAIDTINIIFNDDSIDERLQDLTNAIETLLAHQDNAKFYGAKYKHNFDEEIEEIIKTLNNYEFETNIEMDSLFNFEELKKKKLNLFDSLFDKISLFDKVRALGWELARYKCRGCGGRITSNDRKIEIFEARKYEDLEDFINKEFKKLGDK